MWKTALPQHEGENSLAWIDRVKRKLKTIYERHGYTQILGWVMARSVEPHTAESGDRRLRRPNPPELLPNGHSPSSVFETGEESGSGEPISMTGNPLENASAGDSEQQEPNDPDDPDDYIPL